MKHLVVIALLALAMSSCHSKTSSGDQDADAGTDTDSDSDTDADTDTDTDTGSDTWPEFESDCQAEAINGLEITWCYVPAGTFRMGCPTDLPTHGACGPDSWEVHDVTLSEYEIMDREVSVEMYRACIEAGPCDNIQHYQAWDPETLDNDSFYSCRMDRDPTYDYPYGYDDHPMNCVDWHGMDVFCEWIGGRLPTEAEWEHAARGDHDGLNGEFWVSPYSPEVLAEAGERPCSHGNYRLSDGEPCEFWDTSPAGTLKHTSFGLFDISGNLAEWVSDWWAEDYYELSEETDPQGPADGEYRVVRGGGAYVNWMSDDWNSFVVGRRDKLPPFKDDMDDLPMQMEADYGGYAMYKIGGRCARSVD